MGATIGIRRQSLARLLGGLILLMTGTVEAADPSAVFIGTGSCSSTSCHKGRREPLDLKGSEYEFSGAYDPHNRAYSVLYGDRSRTIFKNLKDHANYANTDPEKLRPITNDLCLRCHVYQGYETKAIQTRSETFALEDGVGCEGCHGPAGKWLVPHTEGWWKGLTEDQKQNDFGMYRTKDLLARGQNCTECHIGVNDTDMNHDLIAAGHPRLNFEYGSQLAKLPKHWRISDDKARNADYEAKVWVLGQIISTKATVDLLASRADRASKDEAPWPELSEYSCFSCHHDVAQVGWRNSFEPADPNKPLKPIFVAKRGNLPWGSWILPVTTVLTETDLDADLPGTPLGELKTLMVKPLPDERDVLRQARAASRRLDQLARQINENPNPIPADKVKRMLANVLSFGDDGRAIDWDQAAQQYLAVVALDKGLADLEPGYSNPATRSSLERLYTKLNLPRKDCKQTFDSPNQYTPRLITEDLQKLQAPCPNREGLRHVEVVVVEAGVDGGFRPGESDRLLNAGARRGQTAMQEGAPRQSNQNFFFKGSNSCGGSSCHEYPESSKENYKSYWAIGFMKRNEFNIWKTEDKHSQAYSNLLSDRGKQMGQLLGVEVTSQEAGCLGCHSSGDDLVKARAGDSFNTSDGVSCENCHGPSSKWVGEHTESRFRETNAGQRAELGMIDLRNPATQANQCLSCHIGEIDKTKDVGSQKLVTHEMYAAGHPPLPSIEVATFSEIMHPHWIHVSEKKNDKIKLIPGYQYKPDQKDRSKLAIIGAAIALKKSMRLIADEAETVGKDKIPGHDWPDYSRFDCWSCHHDLKRESWRQARGYSAAPGRPPLSDWPFVIVELGAEMIEGIDKSNSVEKPRPFLNELKARQDAIRADLDARPFGRKSLPATAEKLAKLADDLTVRLSEVTYNDKQALALFGSLLGRTTASKDDKYPVFGYDEARQIAWTMQILMLDSGSLLPHRPEIETAFKKIEAGLKLDLASGQNRQIIGELGEAMTKLNDYEPSDFHKHLKEIQSILIAR